MRVLIAGGGTGGHLFPGIAVAQELKQRLGAEVSFVGSSYGIESRAVPRAGFPVDLLPIRGLLGEGAAGMLRAFWRLPLSTVAAWRVLARRRPELVIGVGGYASFPAVVAALVRRIPVVLLEQNAKPGLTTRLLARFARCVCVSMPQAREALRGARVVVTGNPIRGFGASVERSTAAGAFELAAARRDLGTSSPGFRLLVFGGSAGAHRLNQIVPEAARRVGRKLAIVHQTGAADRAAVENAYRVAGLEAEVHEFIDDMPREYARADLVVCRAGATTLAELTALGVPAILVPYPFAAADHQRWNAAALVDAGAAWMILDRDLDPEQLGALMRRAIDDPATLATMRERARLLGRPDAAARVVAECLTCLEPSRRRAGLDEVVS
jgi:UDP-N-acetylglucosamine--N-acetylmuramyl-(pentapeptide) pyrophosphoryl-undecaprenol N-acetylglucosamine transferase